MFMVILGIQRNLGQNLVLNPGLDTYITCPGFGQFSGTYITNWSKPNIASSDYYHFTCPNIQPTVQFPHSGEGYAGIIAYNFGTEYREYITGTLSTPLQAGKTYSVEFYSSLNNGYIQAINELGAYLSVSAPGPFSNVLHISVTPQIENNTPLQDTANWMKVSGSFVATGGEQYITIGNFNNDANTTITQPGSVGSFGAFYFIDDVRVSEDTTVSLSEFNPEVEINIMHQQGYLQINLDEGANTPHHIKIHIYNSIGTLVSRSESTSSQTSIPWTNHPQGIYFIQVMNKDKMYGVVKKYLD
jgi:hypothetical protein